MRLAQGAMLRTLVAPRATPEVCHEDARAPRSRPQGLGGRTRPTIVDGDAIVRVGAVPTCGPDLHILRSDVPAVNDGLIHRTRRLAAGGPHAAKAHQKEIEP
jgi:hypothetical protein